MKTVTAAVVLVLALGSALAARSEQAPPKAAPEPPAPRMEQVFLVLLKRGPSWSPEDTPERRTIQEGHMANIRALSKERKLVIAGPMGDDGELRGLFVFRVATQDEAQALLARDPAVKAGRLAAEIHPWWVEKGALPEAGEYCTAPPQAQP